VHGDSTKPRSQRQGAGRTNFAQIAAVCVSGQNCLSDGSLLRVTRVTATTKCTEPVAPSSGFPTDLRRSGCRSESHQPRTLRTRCKPHPRGRVQPRQGALRGTSRNLRFFLYARVELRATTHALALLERRNGPGTRPDPKEFAEPGTLSSTFPTNLPLPRSAPRGASSYRRPVLGAVRTLRHLGRVLQVPTTTNFSEIARSPGRPRPLADPGLAVPEGAERPSPRQLEVELLRFEEPGRGEHLESVGRVHELEVAVRRLGTCLEHVSAPATAAVSSGPDVDRPAALVDVLSDDRISDESHTRSLGCGACVIARGRS